MIAIEAKNLGKWYRKQGVGLPTLVGALPRWLSGGKADGFLALQDINFSIRQGQTVGVIGPNGSGKSSLLGLIAQTMVPTEGTVRTTGRISALLELETAAKVGFGLAGDHQQIRRTLGVSPRNVLDLNAVFRSRGYAKELGVRGAVAVVFNRRFIKSRKATTSNWANRQLTDSQIVYSANDAWAAIQVFHALGLPPPQA